jgi:hypothetical protein
LVPIHPPEAEHPTAAVLVHESTLVPPAATFGGAAVIITVGVGATAMRTVFEAAASMQATEYVVSAETGPQCSPVESTIFRFSSVTWCV